MEKKTKRQNNLTYIVLVVVLLILSVLVAVTGIARRHAAETPPSLTDTPDIGKKPVTEQPVLPPETKAPETQPSGGTDEPAEQVSNTLPLFELPVDGAISKDFAVDVPVFSLTMEDYRTHAGIDIAAAVGDPVRAAADGIVGKIYDDPFMGTCLTILHSGGAVSIYKNLAEATAPGIAVGTAVTAGQEIGYIGETALLECAEETHLHYELTVAGKNVDPTDYLPAAAMTGSFED
ncbi:MAG: M23 family metallopeptidase [Clostridia bacterium]|nr:M23 family metallopeptidase [Clostridia bacterium]